MGQTREQKVIKQLSNPVSVQKRTAIATDMFLPNHSGIASHPEFKEALAGITETDPIFGAWYNSGNAVLNSLQLAGTPAAVESHVDGWDFNGNEIRALGALYSAGIFASNLTSGRVVITSTNGWLTDSSSLTYTSDILQNAKAYSVVDTAAIISRDTAAFAASVGGAISFGGKYNTTSYTNGAYVRAKKTNSTANNADFGLAFGVMDSGFSMKEPFLIRTDQTQLNYYQTAVANYNVFNPYIRYTPASADTTTSTTSVNAIAEAQGSNRCNALLGLLAWGKYNGSAYANNSIRGLNAYASAGVNTNGTSPLLEGGIYSISNDGASSIITAGVGLKINRPVNAGTITNTYGIYIMNQAAAAGTQTNAPYAIYSENGKVNLQGLPTAAAGLSTGDLWNNSGVINIV